ncbi:MAG: NUDIX hydrolase [Chloroflexota bacterium]|nr:NUDIX hydrolase [Chloroflexota bacterium]
MPAAITSAGGVVYRQEGGNLVILMIADSQGRWSFPKGMVQRGEDPATAALREVQEETGIVGQLLRLLGETRYIYRQSGQLVTKTVYFYLIRAQSQAITPQLSEVADARWFPSAEALRRSAFAANTDLLRKAIDLLTAEGADSTPLT